jgi:hypothetical protein
MLREPIAVVSCIRLLPSTLFSERISRPGVPSRYSSTAARP